MRNRHPSPRWTRRDVLDLGVRAAASVAVGSVLSACTNPTSSASSRPADRADAASPAGGKRLRLGLDTYSLHRSLTASDPQLRLDLPTVLSRLDGLGLTGLQIDPSHFPGDDDKTLQRLADAIAPHDYYLEFGMGGWTVDRLAQRIRLTARFGGRAVRTFCGDERSTSQQLALYLQAAPPALREAGAIAAHHGLFIAVENHGDFTSRQIIELIEQTNHPHVGVCFDTGNSLFRDEDPMDAARALLPYAHSMHLKDWHMTRAVDGSPQWREAVLGTGQVPVAEILRMTAQQRPGLYVAMETPIQPTNDAAETVKREWAHVTACAAAARRMIAALG